MSRRIERPPDARTVTVIEVVFNRGEGIVGDPVRQVARYFSLEGELLAESDDWQAAEQGGGHVLPDSLREVFKR